MSGLKIRVLSGCQMDGLVCALRILLRTADVEGFHTYRLLGNDREEIHADVRSADILFAAPLEAKFGDLSFGRILTLGPRIQFIPDVVFAAFHPDIVYLERADGSNVQTPMTNYNSLVAVAAYLNGFDVKQTVRLYNAYTYQALSYFLLLEGSKASLLADFASHGIDLGEALSRWLTRPDAFMYSVNHPRNFVLADVAVASSRAAGVWDERSAPDFDTMPDHLAGWVVYPVFKEIAARLGKVGSKVFKLVGPDDTNCLSLDAFVAKSFESYQQDDTARWVVTPRIASARSTLMELANRSPVFANAK